MATIKVKKGDTLSKIAQNAGISLSALLKLNPQIKNPNLINPGQVITTSKPTPAKPTPAATPNIISDIPVGRDSVTTSTSTPLIDTAKAEALSPAGMRAALDKINADEAAKAFALGEPYRRDRAAATANAAAIAAANAATQLPDIIDEKNYFDGPPVIVDPNVVTEVAGNYTFDVKTGILLLDGKPYTGTYNGFDYENGNKKTATTQTIIDLNDKPLGVEGLTDAQLARLDAFEQLKGLFESYNLGSLAGKITEYMKAGKGPNETVLLLKKSDEYNLRFQGNTLRLAAGLNVISENAYLELEDSYAETLTRYGLRSMLSTDRTKNEAMFAKFMGNDLAAPEFKSRIELATDRVINADPATKETFKKFFPNITDADLVSYFLSPKDTLSKLQEKATTAEIGAVALSQGLTTSLTSATDLAKFGVDRAAAVQGYAAIKEVLPTSQKLGSIYDEAGIKYDQASGEAEFLKLNEDARLKRKRLESLERGSFSGSSGMAASALRKSSTAGQV